MKTQINQSTWTRWIGVLVIAGLLLAGLPVQPAFAAGADRYVITTGADAGDCTASPCHTVAYAVAQSNSGDTIHIAAGQYPANLVVDKSLTFIGAGMNPTFLDGGGIGQVMKITNASAEVNISDLAILGGYTAASSGGGIYNLGELNLTRVKVMDNYALWGGGIFSTGPLSMTECLSSAARLPITIITASIISEISLSSSIRSSLTTL